MGGRPRADTASAMARWLSRSHPLIRVSPPSGVGEMRRVGTRRRVVKARIPTKAGGAFLHPGLGAARGRRAPRRRKKAGRATRSTKTVPRRKGTKSPARRSASGVTASEAAPQWGKSASDVGRGATAEEKAQPPGGDCGALRGEVVGVGELIPAHRLLSVAPFPAAPPVIKAKLRDGVLAHEDSVTRPDRCLEEPCHALDLPAP